MEISQRGNEIRLRGLARVEARFGSGDWQGRKRDSGVGIGKGGSETREWRLESEEARLGSGD